jgi:hypothetical protein
VRCAKQSFDVWLPLAGVLLKLWAEHIGEYVAQTSDSPARP